jgi:signal transduction histidine kinase
MSNAIKFTEHGKVTLSLNEHQGGLLVSVEDTGIGIKEEDIPMIFEQFRQIDGSLTRKVGGTGLGIPISKKLVELHGGEMWVESEPQVGSTFWFNIPASGITGQQSGTGPLKV